MSDIEKKTCDECKHWENGIGFCSLHDIKRSADGFACREFKSLEEVADE